MVIREEKVCTACQNPTKSADHEQIGRKCLGAYSVHHLCKSIIVENTKWTPELAEGGGEFTDKRYPRFYCIIVQYTTKMMSHKVFKFARSQKPEGAQKHFHFNQAKAKVVYFS